MAKVIEQSVKKTRYISVRLAGDEVYVENVSTEGDLLGAVPAGTTSPAGDPESHASW